MTGELQPDWHCPVAGSSDHCSDERFPHLCRYGLIESLEPARSEQALAACQVCLAVPTVQGGISELGKILERAVQPRPKLITSQSCAHLRLRLQSSTLAQPASHLSFCACRNAASMLAAWSACKALSNPQETVESEGKPHAFWQTFQQ